MSGMIRRALIAFFVAVLGVMLWTTVQATRERGVFDALAALWGDAWFRATLADAYCGFLTFFCWVAYKERGWVPRLVWLVAILLLGNLAMATYALKELWRWRDGEPAALLLLRRPA